MELLKDEFEYRKIQQKEFAKKFELSYTVLNETLNAKRPVFQVENALCRCGMPYFKLRMHCVGAKCRISS